MTIQGNPTQSAEPNISGGGQVQRSSFSILHTQIAGARPHWYQVETSRDHSLAVRRAYNYALNHGGYVCVKDGAGEVVFGTDPQALDRCIAAGGNRDFSEPSL